MRGGFMHPMGSIFFLTWGVWVRGGLPQRTILLKRNNIWQYTCIYKALQVGSQSWIATFLPIPIKLGKFVNASKIANNETN